MFGLVCSGRPVQMAEQVDNLKFVFNVPNATNISHVSLFLLPNTPFDANYAALIYFKLPESEIPQIQEITNNGDDFKLLGMISTEKPSAIFKIKNKKVNNKNDINNNTRNIDDDDMMIDGGNNINQMNEAVGQLDINEKDTLTIGISIEPLMQANQILKEYTNLRSTNNEPLLLQNGGNDDNTIAAGAVDLLSKEKLAVLANRIVGNAYNYLSGFVDNNNKVSMKVLDGWWEKFKQRIQNDPRFLENEI